ncbi:hypothetical protein [Actinokineospora cianjurensis]|nr:hypothetical protein [Actinokineospora cianjurensis]
MHDKKSEASSSDGTAIKVAWIGLAGVLGAALIGAVVALNSNKGVGTPTPTGGNYPPYTYTPPGGSGTSVGDPPPKPPVTTDPPQRAGYPTLTLSSQVVKQGGTYEVSGSGFSPESAITLRIFSSDSISFPISDFVEVDSRGGFSQAAVLQPGVCDFRGQVAAFDGVHPAAIAQVAVVTKC